MIIHYRARKEGPCLEDSDLDKMLAEVAQLFVMSPSTIGYSVRRGETIAEENSYQLMG